MRFNKRYQLHLTSCSNVNQGIFRGVGVGLLTCLQALRLFVNPPLQLLEKGARSQLHQTFILNFLNILCNKFDRAISAYDLGGS
jgi:hypothetical protein